MKVTSPELIREIVLALEKRVNAHLEEARKSQDSQAIAHASFKGAATVYLLSILEDLVCEALTKVAEENESSTKSIPSGT